MLEHLGWAREVAASIARTLPTWFLVDDLTGPAEIGLIQAADRYDPSRNSNFRAFARRYVCGRCIDSIRRREYKERAHTSLDAPPEKQNNAGSERDTRDARNQEAVSPGPSPEEHAIAAERAARLGLVWISVLEMPNRHRAVIIRVYLMGMTLEEIAATLGLGASSVSKIHREALAMLRESCADLRKAA